MSIKKSMELFIKKADFSCLGSSELSSLDGTMIIFEIVTLASNKLASWWLENTIGKVFGMTLRLTSRALTYVQYQKLADTSSIVILNI